MSIAVACAIAVAAGTVSSVAVQPARPASAAADFGTPPGGEVPILFNDQHVYAKPDTLKSGRVLAALVRGNTILVPLRSMFEQMGATVSYDSSKQTAVVTKPGSEVRVTVGRPEVIINGETRPLDVPPMVYKGSVVVPIRVLSEAMGAYVQWVPEKHVVVVRYVQAPVPTAPPPVPTAPPTPVPTAPPTVAPPPPTPAPTLRPTPVPTPTPSPTPSPVVYEHFIVGDYIISPKTYNEFAPGTTSSSGSWAGRGVAELPLLGLPWMVEVDARQYSFTHPTGFVTTIGRLGQTLVPAFTGQDRDLDARIGLKVFNPRVYLGVGYMWRNTSYGYPKQTGIGYGIEKLPDLDQRLSAYGSAWYYPNVRAPLFIDNATGRGFTVSYGIWKYNIGVTYNIGTSNGVPGPFFLDASLQGERGIQRLDAPVGFNHNGAAVGVGVHF